ncbi:hypothetical protein Tco_1142601 [Tanacetum coccineum]
MATSSVLWLSNSKLHGGLKGYFNSIANPRGEVRAITTRSGLSYTPVPPIPPPLYDVNEPLIEKEPRVTRIITVQNSPEPSYAQVDNSPPSKRPSKETRLHTPSRVLLEREKKDSNDKVQISKGFGKCSKDSCDITLADALIFIAKLPEKLGDPGRFLIPCGFGEFDKHLALADLGASINLMPLSIWKKLGLPDLTNFVAEPRVLRDLVRLSYRIVFKPDGSQDNESIHMMNAYDDQVKDVCEPESNDDSTTSAIVDDFESLLGYDEEIISNEASSIISPKIDVKTIMSFFAPIGNFARKWATSEVEKDNVEVNHEVFKSDSENVLGIHDDKEEEIAFLDSLLEDVKFLEMMIKKVDSFEVKQKKILKQKLKLRKRVQSSKELAPSKALLTLDVFDPLHPPLMEFHEKIEKTKRSKNDQKPTRNEKKTKNQEQDKGISQKSQPDQPDTVKLSQR